MPQPPASICHHNCPDKIKLKSGIDTLLVRSAFPPSTVLDPAAEQFEIVLRNANGIIYQATLQPGDLVQVAHTFRFKDKGARRGQGIRGGLSQVLIAPVTGGTGTRVNVEAWGDLDAATEAEMTLEITVGDDATEVTSTWEKRAFGWLRTHR